MILNAWLRSARGNSVYYRTKDDFVIIVFEGTRRIGAWRNQIVFSWVIKFEDSTVAKAERDFDDDEDAKQNALERLEELRSEMT